VETNGIIKNTVLTLVEGRVVGGLVIGYNKTREQTLRFDVGTGEILALIFTITQSQRWEEVVGKFLKLTLDDSGQIIIATDILGVTGLELTAGEGGHDESGPQD